VTPLLAASPPEEGEPGRPASEATSDEVGLSGIRIVVDPKTGEIVSIRTRENRALSEALARALSRSAEGLEVFDVSGGGKGVHLGGRFQHVMTAKVKKDGSVELGCVDSALKAKDVLYRKAAASDDASRDR
jgi:hypothetical protein